MAQISQQINELIKQRNDLADNISAKGISATKTEKYNTLIDKVNDIEIVKGEEIILENTAKYNDIPSSIVSVEYPEQKNLFDINNTPTLIGTTTTYTVENNKITFNSSSANSRFIFKAIPLTVGKQYTVSVSSIDYNGVGIAGLFLSYNTIPDNFFNYIHNSRLTVNFTATQNTLYIKGYVKYSNPEDCYVTFENLQVEEGSTATPYEPFKTYDIGVQLQSKNLIPYPFTFETTTSYGITFTDNKNGTITLDGQLNDSTVAATYVIFNNITVDKLGLKPNTEYSLSCSDSILTISLGTVKTDGTYNYYSRGHINFPETEVPDRLFIQVKKNDTRTFENTVISVQCELGSIATAYTPYISDFSSSNLNTKGNNLIFYPYTSSSYTNNGITYTVNTDGTLVANGTFENIAKGSFITITNLYSSYLTYLKLPLGHTYTISGSPKIEGLYTEIRYCNLENGSPLDGAKSNNGMSKTFITTTDVQIPGVQIQLTSNGTVSTIENVIIKPQIEVGSTATEYTPYQGTTYTANADGTVSNVKSIYPLTNLISDNNTTMTVSSGTYKQITPSSGKNSFTKAYQPTVDSSIDSNIKPEYIRKGVTILGVTGTYEPTTEES